jgi:hypothetical protein
MNPVAIADLVLELSENDDYEGILNIAGLSQTEKITKKSSLPTIRKAYLKLSLVIHPDKMKSTYPNATKAFQALVKAFEYLTGPEIIIEEDNQKGRKKQKEADKTKTISRSNEGCYRTRVCCPRCLQPWSENTLDGNPDYFYNFLMTGLKQYTCSTCLCEFGCMSGIHKCPFCHKKFEYNPQDYHLKIECGNKGCNKKFGFILYPASDRVMKEMKKSVKEEQERRLKAREAKLRRLERSNRGLTKVERDKAFLFGLIDCCPRCGEDFTEISDEEEQRKHLMECNDETKHKMFEMKKKEETKFQEGKKKVQEKQESIQNHAAWQFLGSNTNQLWLLDEEQIRNEAKKENIDATGSKDELICKIVQKKNYESDDDDGEHHNKSLEFEKTQKLIKNESNLKHTNESSNALVNRESTNNKVVVSRKRKQKVVEKDVSTLPSNLHSMTLARLKSFCASNNLMHLVKKNSTKSDLLELIEEEFYE